MVVDHSGGFQTLRWEGGIDGHLVLLDQTKLPGEIVERRCRSVEDVWEAIRTLRVRGAPAIGIAAAYGVVLAAQAAAAAAEGPSVWTNVEQATAYLATSRPTAVNLFWALERMERSIRQDNAQAPRSQLAQRLLEEARAIHQEDQRDCRAIGQVGAALLEDGAGVLTH